MKIDILEVLEFILLVGGVTAVLSRWLNPYRKLKEKLRIHDEKLDNHDRLFSNDKKSIDDIKITNNLLLQSNLVMLEHLINGNGKEEYKLVKDKIQKHLIDR